MAVEHNCVVCRFETANLLLVMLADVFISNLGDCLPRPS